jgi:hypothetical protein
MKIILRSLPLRRIRNNQCGDWWLRASGKIEASSARMSDERSEIAVAIHELIEAWLCRAHGVTDEAVCAFDAMFEEERTQGLHDEEAEAGDDPRAPYRSEHKAATAVEREVCDAFGLTWPDHCRNVAEVLQNSS